MTKYADLEILGETTPIKIPISRKTQILEEYTSTNPSWAKFENWCCDLIEKYSRELSSEDIQRLNISDNRDAPTHMHFCAEVCDNGEIVKYYLDEVA